MKCLLLQVKTGRKHAFFQRSDSTTFLGCAPPDPFKTPLVEALPLADQPHILQPNSRREDLFGMPKQPLVSMTEAGEGSSSQPSLFDRLPTHLALSVRSVDNLPPSVTAPSTEVPPCSASTSVASSSANMATTVSSSTSTASTLSSTISSTISSTASSGLAPCLTTGTSQGTNLGTSQIPSTGTSQGTNPGTSQGTSQSPITGTSQGPSQGPSPGTGLGTSDPTSVIVKPASLQQVASLTSMDTSHQGPNPDEEPNSRQAPQTSVIVHAGSAQPLLLPSSESKEDESPAMDKEGKANNGTAAEANSSNR